MANYQDEMDREALLGQMGQEEPPIGGTAVGGFGEPAGGGFAPPVDPVATPLEGTPQGPMDVYNQRLKDNVVSSDPVQRARELADAEGAQTLLKKQNAGMNAEGVKSALGGYDPAKMTAEHAAKSPKYAFGMLAQEYPDTPEGLIAMSKDPRFAAAGFRLAGKDKIYAPDPDQGGALGLVDVGNSFSVGGGKGWQWGAEPGSSGGPMPEGDPGQSGMIDQGALMAGQDYGSEGFFQRLLQQLQQQAGPESTDREALLRMVGA